MLQVEGKKMSKSLGNFFTVRDLLDQGVPGEVIRFVFLGTHYSKPMDWTEKKAEEAKGHLRAWNKFKSHALSDRKRTFTGEGVAPEIIEALCDDLNTSLAISRLFELALEAKRSGEIDSPATIQLFESLAFLGFGNLDIERSNRRSDIANALIKANLEDMKTRLQIARNTAKQANDFSQVDALKSALTAAGVEVRMSKDGVELIPGPNFDPSKLEGLL
jgi:cysteinyl-tRNA synthetase